MKTITYRMLAMITLILVIGALGLLARHFGSLEWIVENETRMRQFVRQQPWLGWFIGLAIYTTFSLVPGTAGKSVVVGWVFGFWPAVLMVDIGLTIAAVGGFLSARFFVGELVKSRSKVLVEKLNRLLEKDGTFFLIMLRVAHAPYSLVNYCAGATSVPLGMFAWTTALGILPGTMISVFIGTRIPTLAAISEKGSAKGEAALIWQLFDPLLFGLLAAAILFPFLIRWAVGKFRSGSAKELSIELSELDALASWSAKGNSHVAD